MIIRLPLVKHVITHAKPVPQQMPAQPVILFQKESI